MRTLVLVFALGGAHGNHPADRWFGEDKVKHFFISAFIESVSYSALRVANVPHDPALVTASVLTVGTGIAKEVHDRKSYGLFSVMDLSWDVAGTGAAAVVLAHTR